MEISVEPYKKLSIRSYLEYDSPEELARYLALSVPLGASALVTLRWSNGVLFAVSGFQPSDSIIKEYIAGHVLYDHIDFALMPNYKSEIRLEDRPTFILNVLNLSEHPLFNEIGEWIKKNLAKKKGPKMLTVGTTLKKSKLVA